MAPIPTTPATGTTKTTKNGDIHWYSIKYNDLLLKYTLEFWGQQPATGYPLYIGLHGGGSGTSADNDNYWAHMVKYYYHDEVKALAESNNGTSGAAYTALRGISSWTDKDRKNLQETHDIHFRPESFVLIQQLLWNLLAKNPEELKQKYENQEGKLDDKSPHFIDSNNVHLMGFSAGGDGAFNIARCLPDLFASVVPAAGYATGESNDNADAKAFFENYANLPAWLQVGEQDNDSYWTDLDDQGRSKRAKFYYHYDQALHDLQGSGQYYLHKTDIVKGGHHGDWFDSNNLNALRPCIRNLELWFKDTAKTSEVKMSDDHNLNPVKFPDIFKGKLERSMTPHYVVWNLNQRPSRLYEDSALPDTKWETKRFFYWLFDRKPSKTLAAPPTKTIHARYVTDTAKEESTIHINDVNDYIGILLREPMVSFKHPITVKCGNWTKTINVSANTNLTHEIYAARGDRHMTFTAMLYFEKDGNSPGNWEVRSASTLTADNGEAPIGKLVQ